MDNNEYLDKFEDGVKKAIYAYLLQHKCVDEHMAEVADMESKWKSICEAYLPDGVREFTNYPLSSLGWMMYVGMAVANMWDMDWEQAQKHENIYTFLRDIEGYDTMDEMIRRDILCVKDEEYTRIEDINRECSQLCVNFLHSEQLEPGTPLAFYAYVNCLHQLYLMGARMELFRLGYKMTAVN